MVSTQQLGKQATIVWAFSTSDLSVSEISATLGRTETDPDWKQEMAGNIPVLMKKYRHKSQVNPGTLIPKAHDVLFQRYSSH